MEVFKGDSPITPRWLLLLRRRSDATKFHVGLILVNKQLHVEGIRVLHRSRVLRLELSSQSCSLIATTGYVLYAAGGARQSLLASLKGFHITNIVMPMYGYYSEYRETMMRITLELTCDEVNVLGSNKFYFDKGVPEGTPHRRIYLPVAIECMADCLRKSSAVLLAFGKKDEVLETSDASLRQSRNNGETKSALEKRSAWNSFLHCWKDRLVES